MAAVADIEDAPASSVHSSTSAPWAIAASARTDIPGCYMPMMMKWLRQGFVDVPNPMFQQSVTRVMLNNVQLIAWWSKNYGPWIREFERKEALRNFTHYFNFTINSESTVESRLTVGLEERLLQLRYLVQTFGVDAVNLRFDPIVHWTRTSDGENEDNLSDFDEIVEIASSFGVKEVSFSFCSPHRKTLRLMLRRGKILRQLSLPQQKEVLDSKVIPVCNRFGVTLRACCSSLLVGHNGVVASSCVDPAKVGRLMPKLPSRARGGLQKECACLKVRDIGSYSMKCPHSCDYCYANPKE